MIQWADVFFMSDEKSGMVHPAGDGLRRLLVIRLPNSRVYAYSVTHLEGREFEPMAWTLLRAKVDAVDDHAATVQRILRKRDELQRQKVPFHSDETEMVLGELYALAAPPARVRTRTR